MASRPMWLCVNVCVMRNIGVSSKQVEPVFVAHELGWALSSLIQLSLHDSVACAACLPQSSVCDWTHLV